MSQNPVCHIPPPTVAVTRDVQSIGTIPAPQPNLASLMATVAALRNAVTILANQLNASRSGTLSTKAQPSKPTWNEVERDTTTVRVFQNNDKNSPNWVDIQQINSLTMQDKSTGSTWKWVRGAGTPG